MSMLSRWIDRQLDKVRVVLFPELIIANEDLTAECLDLRRTVELRELDLEDRNKLIARQKRRILDLEEKVKTVDPIANGLDRQRHHAAQQRIRDLETEVENLRRICRGD